MSLALTLPGTLGGAGPLRVLGPAFAGRIQVIRAGPAQAQDAAGTFQMAGADTPRFAGRAQWLMVEEARTNVLRNPHCEGATPGVLGGGGALPSFWGFDGTAPSTTVLGAGTEDGLPYVDLRFSGSSTFALRFEASTRVAAMAGQNWVASLFLRHLAGSMANLTLQNSLSVSAAPTGQFLNQSYEPLEATGAALGWQRSAAAWTLPGSGNCFVNSRLRLQAAGAFNVTLRLAAPQLELGTVATSPIPPVAGAQSPATRSADMPAWSPPGGFGPSGTVVLQARLPAAAPFGTIQGLLQLDDGGDANRLTIRNTSGGAGIYGVADREGTTLAALPGGNMTPGTPFRAALAWAPGELAFCMNGTAVQAAAVVPPGGLSRMLLGHAGGALNRAANGEIGTVEFCPARLPDSLLQALTATA